MQEYQQDLQKAIDARCADHLRDATKTVHNQDDQAAMVALESLMLDFDAGDSNDAPRRIAHDECYTMNRGLCHKFAQQTIAVILDGKVPGVRFAETGITQADADYLVQRLKEAQESDEKLRARVAELEAVNLSITRAAVDDVTRLANERDALKAQLDAMIGFMCELLPSARNVIEARYHVQYDLAEKCDILEMSLIALRKSGIDAAIAAARSV